jgi:hypothetical protein
MLLAIGTDASAGSDLQRAVQTAPFPGLAYAQVPAASGFEYDRILFGSGTVDVGPLQSYFFSGGFADNDFTHEYAIDYPFANLYSIDTSDASTTLIGNINLSSGDSARAGPRWDPTSGESFLMAVDDSCSQSTLYAVDLSTAATTPIGISSGTCIVAIAIDPAGIMYGVDIVGEQMVVVDKSNGQAQVIASLGVQFNHPVAMDVNPVDGALYIIGFDDATFTQNIYVFDGALVPLGPTDASGPFAFAVDSDIVFFNGFELP